MKAERRHELSTTSWRIGSASEWRSWQPQAAPIVLGLALLAVAVLGGIWYFGGEDRVSAEGWSEYFDAFNKREPGKALEALAAKKPGSKAALWALQSLGDMNLGQGAALLHSDRAEAQKLLQKAEASYKRLETAAASDAAAGRASETRAGESI